MADQKISQLTSYTTAIVGDLLVVVDVTTGVTKKINIGDLFSNTVLTSLKIIDDAGTTRTLKVDASGNPYTV
jgi:hypothetical protein